MMTAIPKEHGVSWVQRGCRLPTPSAIPFPSAKVHLSAFRFHVHAILTPFAYPFRF
jgi:hypothetical protein